MHLTEMTALLRTLARLRFMFLAIGMLAATANRQTLPVTRRHG